MKNAPSYGIASVDHALRLIILLQQQGPLGVAEAAERLGVARSTAHRLLAMLVYHDFAEQDAQRRYTVGPVLRDGPGPFNLSILRTHALPHLRDLVRRTDETANLVVLADDRVRFVATVESSQVLRVGDREGRSLPAHLASGGQVLLAALSEAELAAVVARANDPSLDLATLRRTLRRVRRDGFALNQQATERGVTAIGKLVQPGPAVPAVAISLAMPSLRYRRTALAGWVAELSATAAALETTLGHLRR